MPHSSSIWPGCGESARRITITAESCVISVSRPRPASCAPWAARSMIPTGLRPSSSSWNACAHGRCCRRSSPPAAAASRSRSPFLNRRSRRPLDGASPWSRESGARDRCRWASARNCGAGRSGVHGSRGAASRCRARSPRGITTSRSRPARLLPPEVSPWCRRRACYEPAAVLAGRRLWGLAVQLYTVRSAVNWGVGDFGDLAALIRWVSRHGAGFIGLNPLHALAPADPRRASPYSASNRHVFNVLYIAVPAVAEYAMCGAARARVADREFQARLIALRAVPAVDYAGVADAKFEILELLHREFCDRHLARGAQRAARFRRVRRLTAADASRARAVRCAGCALPRRRTGRRPDG